MKVWILLLLQEYNDYNQHGDYFVDVFFTKPTIEQLKEYGISELEACHILSTGGGRINENCDKWYFLDVFENEDNI